MKYFELVVDFRYSAIILALALCIFSSVGISKLKIVSDFEVFFGEDNPELIAFHELQDVYGKSDNVIFIVTPENKNVFSKESLNAVLDLTAKSWMLPYSLRVESITNYQHTSVDNDDLDVSNLIESGAMSDARLSLAKEVALSEVSLKNRLINTDASVTGVLVTFQLPRIDKNKEIQEVILAVKNIRDEINKNHVVNVRLQGRIVNSNAFREMSLKDMKELVPLAFLIAMFCVTFYFFYVSRSFITVLGATFTSFSVIAFSILTALGFAGHVGINITPPIANAPAMILTLAVADSMHLFVSFFHELRNGNTRHDAMKLSLRANYSPVFITSITTVIGFLSLNYSDSPPFRDLGNVVAVGVIAAWFYSVVLLPAMLQILPVNAKHKNNDNDNGIMESIGYWVINNYKRILFYMTPIIILAIAFIPVNNLNDVWAEYFDESTVQRQNSDYLRENLTSAQLMEFSLAASSEGGVNDIDYLRTVDDFTAWLRIHPHVYYVFSYTDVLKRINKTMHNDDANWYTLPSSRNLAAQYSLLYEMSLPYGLDMSNQVSINKDATRLIVAVKNSSTHSMLELQKDAYSWLTENAPKTMLHRGSSSDVMFAHMSYRNSKSMLVGTAIGLLLISIVLIVALRSWKYGALSLIPNIIPAAVGFGIWGLFIGEVGLSLSVVAGMTMGIVVDFSVHFLSKYLTSKRQFNQSTEKAIIYSFQTVGIALVVTAVILVANFTVLASSSFALNSDMGLLTTGIIIIALAVNMLFLPSLLVWRNKSTVNIKVKN